MTIAEALRNAAQRLSPVSDTARLDAELLMAHALDVSRSDLLLRHMQEDVPADYEELLLRRLHSEPVAYILGQQEFYGRDFLVSPDVLIPRADSETVIEAALDVFPAKGGRVLDCGVGSGALLLTVLAECAEAEGVGIDRSLPAIEVAAANAARLSLSERCHMLHLDWSEAGWSAGLGRFDLVLANPPYVEEKADLQPSVDKYEPASALYSGPEGLDDYRLLIPQITEFLTENGVAVLEIGFRQAEAVTAIARDAGFDVTLRRDLAGRDRALTLRLKAWQGGG